MGWLGAGILIGAVIYFFGGWLSARATCNEAFAVALLALLFTFVAGGVARYGFFRTNIKYDPEVPPLQGKVVEGPEIEPPDLS
jgi:hypothetical protein